MRVCVVGGGAAGMMCATMIARKGHEVVLFEKNEKLGKKIYITGKGRCNVTNATVGDEFLKNVVGGKKFVMGAYWEQLYMMGGISSPCVVKNVLFRPDRKSDEIVIVVIKGKPGSIIGLDEGVWVSAKNGKLKGEKDIFVMSEAVFKIFSPQ